MSAKPSTKRRRGAWKFTRAGELTEYRTRDAERVFGAFSHRHLLGSGASLS